MKDTQLIGIGLIALGVILAPTVAVQLGLNPIDDAIDGALFITGLALLGGGKK